MVESQPQVYTQLQVSASQNVSQESLKDSTLPKISDVFKRSSQDLLIEEKQRKLFKTSVTITPSTSPTHDKSSQLSVSAKVVNETNVVLQDVGTFFGKISAFKCNFRPICGL